MDINKHPIHKLIYELCLEIEGMPASELQTKISTMASALHEPCDEVINYLTNLRKLNSDLTTLLVAAEGDDLVEIVRTIIEQRDEAVNKLK